MRRKASPLTTNITIFHVDVPSSRVLDRMTRGARQAEQEAGRDGGQHAGDADALGRQVCGERDEEADEHLDRWILQH